MNFLPEEVEGTITANNIKGSLVPSYPIKSSLENFNVHSRPLSKGKKVSPFCSFCENGGHWPQQCNSVTDIDARIQKLKASSRCFYALIGVTYKRIVFAKRNTAVPNAGKNTMFRYAKLQLMSSLRLHLQTRLIHSLTILFIYRERVSITSSTGITKLTRCLLDGGSHTHTQSSFISSDLVNTLNLPVISTRPLDLQAFESLTSFSRL
ncbi:integrase catalytic domain-containing protein [Trichonephila inaurata madagascariensis]|uniref:Integrase catalytic domain-containing protein n=1 Tax=Trichonephila inaurata madagascariensis TaxID=2747483 RepID=A0A8X6WUB5_9ARAC|nr:integrase catalytic domain-containing protein [Trichonephila inaurata madagascariensis]